MNLFMYTESIKALKVRRISSFIKERWWKFTFPIVGMDLLQMAEALTTLGYGADPRLANTLDLIRSKQDESGRWLFEKNYGYWHKWWVNYGSINKPNKWVTLRAMRVLKQAGEKEIGLQNTKTD